MAKMCWKFFSLCLLQAGLPVPGYIRWQSIPGHIRYNNQAVRTYKHHPEILLFLMPKQHCRVGHVPLFPVAGIAESCMRQQLVQRLCGLPLGFSRKADRNLIAIHQLEIKGTAAAQLQPERQAFRNHRIDPDDMPGMVFQQIHQAGPSRPFFL